jgi:hypothetical protein
MMPRGIEARQWAPDILSLLSEQPGIWLIGLHLSSSRVIVLNSYQHMTPTMNDLCQVVQAEAFEKACASNGAASCISLT